MGKENIAPKQGFWAIPRRISGPAQVMSLHVWSVRTEPISQSRFWPDHARVLRIAQLANAKEAILNDGSPSCGVTRTSVYDEDRNLKYVPGCGALTWLLRENGIGVFAQGTYVM